MTLRRVIVGIDGSAGSQRALEWAVGLVAGTEVEVVAVHVLSYYVEMRRDSSIETMTLWRKDLEHQLDGPWTAGARVPGVACRLRTRLVEGESASSGLMLVADEEGADLIVVGAQGHGGIADRVLGGASYRLAHRAHQPVVVVPRDWRPR
jgi:nucleotide-binding universal stress UspA family protein